MIGFLASLLSLALLTSLFARLRLRVVTLHRGERLPGGGSRAIRRGTWSYNSDFVSIALPLTTPLHLEIRPESSLSRASKGLRWASSIDPAL